MKICEGIRNRNNKINSTWKKKTWKKRRASLITPSKSAFIFCIFSLHSFAACLFPFKRSYEQLDREHNSDQIRWCDSTKWFPGDNTKRFRQLANSNELLDPLKIIDWQAYHEIWRSIPCFVSSLSVDVLFDVESSVILDGYQDIRIYRQEHDICADGRSVLSSSLKKLDNFSIYWDIPIKQRRSQNGETEAEEPL